MTELTEAEVERLCGWAVHPGADPSALLDTVAAIIDARLAPIRALADDPIEECEVHTRIADGCEECSVVDALHWYAGRLRAALDAASADLTASQDHDGAEGQGDGGRALSGFFRHRDGRTCRLGPQGWTLGGAPDHPILCLRDHERNG